MNLTSYLTQRAADIKQLHAIRFEYAVRKACPALGNHTPPTRYERNRYKSQIAYFTRKILNLDMYYDFSLISESVKRKSDLRKSFVFSLN